VEAPRTSISYRRIGTILVEMGIVPQAQLDSALSEQRHSGRLLGEILVSSYGVSRVALADALAAQWEEAQSMAEIDEAQGAYHDDGAVDPLAEGDLSVLLEEAQAARAELTARTDELSRRVASLEALVVGVTEALDELRGTEPAGGQQPVHRTSRRGRSRATRR
jgi:methyl-accepting chemotaxis protein